MKNLLLAIMLLQGCTHYDTFTDIYGGANSASGGTVGGRVGQILLTDNSWGAGVAADISGVLREEDGEDVDQVVLAPLLVAVYRFTYFQPYVMAGPALFITESDDDSSTDLGADIKIGAQYEIGHWFKLPAWIFVELRGTYVDPELRETNAFFRTLRRSHGN